MEKYLGLKPLNFECLLEKAKFWYHYVESQNSFIESVFVIDNNKYDFNS